MSPKYAKVLYVDWCTSLENITFQLGRFTLQEFNYEGCFKLCEIEGLFKLVSIAKLDESDLEHMQWIKLYQNHKVDLVGDVITKGRAFIQMLYEYGIRSTFLQGIKDQSMARHRYTSSSDFLSFRVPSHPMKNRIQGLSITILYISLSSDREDRRMLLPIFAKISNITKGLTWAYSPVVFCQPRVENDVVWLSYWPIGNILDAGDEVYVTIFLPKEMMMIVRGCGVSLVYMDDDGLVEKDDERMKGEEVIGGDLSLFQVAKGAYYLCRIDFFKSETPNYLKLLFGDNIKYTTDSQRWRRYSLPLPQSEYDQLNTYRNPKRIKLKVELGVSFSSGSETDKIEKAVSSIVGVESVSTHKEIGRLIVVGRFDVQGVATCVGEYEKMVQVLGYGNVV